ncbi:MAG: hypothetical protein LBR52_01960 [Prevotellaceae bacterium]|jgi:hypothetical protein|nr:hypothetical protein [Prevotellaceae bacterium]
MGAAFGFVGGGAQGFSSAKQQGLNPWTGTKLPETTVNTPVAPAAVQNTANKPANTTPKETPTVGGENSATITPTYDFTPDPLGDNVTLYRGTTGTENNPRFPLYMTDDANYAGSYVSNGGQVVQTTIPRSTIFDMRMNNVLEVTSNPQLHINGTSGIEYKFSPSVKSQIIIRF